MIMDRAAVQDPVLMGRLMVVAVLAQDFKAIKVVMATKVVTIIMGVNSSNSQVTRATRSN